MAMTSKANALIIQSKRVVTPQGVRPAAVLIRDGVIAGVVGLRNVPPDWRRSTIVHDAGASVVMAGLVDTHVHINEPGRTEWEGFETVTRAAAAGGTTTLVDMPLNSIPATTTLGGLRAKQSAVRGKCWVDVGFWGGVVPGNTGELKPLHNAGVFGFKCFLVPSGVQEFPSVSESDLREALPTLAALRTILQVHAELPGPIEEAIRHLGKEDPTRYRTWLRSRPPAAEREAIAMMIRLSRTYRARVHIVHLSDAGAVPILRQARKERLPITVETCPHYLALSPKRTWDTRFKCAPPIRDAKNQKALWTALRRKTIDFIVSDHSPCPPDMKLPETGDFMRSWGGIPSVELRLPIVWTAARQRGFKLADLARWLASEPARFAGFEGRKGMLAKGYDADVVVWNPEGKFQVRPERLHQRHKHTPYAGQTLAGVVEATFLRGRKVFDGGSFIGDSAGALLGRGSR